MVQKRREVLIITDNVPETEVVEDDTCSGKDITIHTFIWKRSIIVATERCIGQQTHTKVLVLSPPQFKTLCVGGLKHGCSLLSFILP